jgi:very-short-patch-repair endonuclease
MTACGHVGQRLPPRTTPARSLIDAAAWAASDREARGIVLAGVRQRLVTVEAALGALDARLVTRRQRLIREALTDASGGVESVPEHDFDRLVSRAALPRPVRQRRLARPSGTLYLDADFEAYGLAVEIDGAPHTDVRAGEADAQREHELVIAGRRVLRFSAWMVRHRPAYVARVLAEALHAGGWTGHPAPWVLAAARPDRLPDVRTLRSRPDGRVTPARCRPDHTGIPDTAVRGVRTDVG